MKNNAVSPRCIASLGAAVTMTLTAPLAQAFGGAGNLGECTTFTTCTAGVYSSAVAGTTYNVSAASPAFPLGPLKLGANPRSDTDFSATTAPALAPNAPCLPNPACANTNPWPTSSSARSQSDFGVNRARADTGPGASGSDNRGPSLVASVSIQTTAEARSSWRDVWSFSADGQFSAPVELDGRSTDAPNLAWPSSFSHSRTGSSGEWFYQLRVWDTQNLGEDSDGFPAPKLVAEVRTQANDEQRRNFAFASLLEFDYLGGVSYVAIAELIVKSANGRDVDLYNTARIGEVLLSPGTTMSALSGRDYVSSPVPEPQAAALWIGGLALVGCAVCRRRASRAA